MVKSEAKTNIDLGKICPELDIIVKYYDNPDNKRRAPISMNEETWRVIAATMLKLAAENERLKDEKIDAIMEAFNRGYNAARKGDAHER